MRRLNLLLIVILAFQVFTVKAMADDELSPIAYTDFEEGSIELMKQFMVRTC